MYHPACGVSRLRAQHAGLWASIAFAVSMGAFNFRQQALSELVNHFNQVLLFKPNRIERVLRAFEGPVVLDADAINAFSANVNAMALLLNGRPAVLTPHPAEFARLAGIAVDDVLKRRFEVGLPLAKHTRAVVLLKGQPTIIVAPGGDRLVSASGTPLLAAAGSGDLLTGMVGTLLAQTGDPLASAACAAWVHGRAASLTQRGRKGFRGLSLDDVVAQLPRAWSLRSGPSRYPVLLELPAIV